jgi:hypothetical protein
MRTLSRVVMALMTTLLLAVGLVAVQTTAADAHPKGSKCKYFSDGPASDHYQLCIKVGRRLVQDDKLIYSSFVENDTRHGRNDATCQSSKSETFRWGGSVSATVEGSAWIFAKVSVTATVSFDKTRTSEFSVSAGFSVPPKTTKYCYYVERNEQYMTRQCFTNAYSGGEKCRDVVFHAPQREGWVISDNPIKY